MTQINTFPDNKAALLIEHAINIFNTMIKRKIIPSKNAFNKLIKSCARASLAKKAVKVYKSMPEKFKEEYMYYYSLVHGFEIEKESSKRKKTSSLHERDFTEEIFELIETHRFFPYVVCILCRLKGLERLIKIDDVLSGFSRHQENDYIQCPYCKGNFLPYAHSIHLESSQFEVNHSFLLMSPVKVFQEVERISRTKGDNFFFYTDYYLEGKGERLFWNLVFYFQVFNLEHFVMAINKGERQIETLIETMKVKQEQFPNSRTNISFRLNTVNSDNISRANSNASLSGNLSRF